MFEGTKSKKVKGFCRVLDFLFVGEERTIGKKLCGSHSSVHRSSGNLPSS